MTDIQAILVRNWTIAYHYPTGATLLTLEWTDRAPMNFAIAKEQAIPLAQAILEHYNTTPPRKDRMS